MEKTVGFLGVIVPVPFAVAVAVAASCPTVRIKSIFNCSLVTHKYIFFPSFSNRATQPGNILFLSLILPYSSIAVLQTLTRISLTSSLEACCDSTRL